MRTIVSLLALAYAASTGSAATQTLNFSSSQISTPAAFEGYAQGGAWGDFNGDGKSDLAIVTNGGSDHPQVLVILLGNGDGTFQPGVVYPLTGRTPQTVVVADFNGDGKQDLAVPCFSGGAGVPGEISLFLGKGDGTFQSAVSITVGNQAGWLAVGRFNNDAKLDMAVPNPNSNQVEVLLGNTNGTFQPAVIYPVGKGPSWIAAADLNDDGKLDLVTANYGTNDVSVLLGKGDGTFAAAASFPAGSGPSSGVTGDIDGDGKLDLAIVDAGSGNLSVLLGNGDGTFQAPQVHSIGRIPNSVVIADFDGDGKMDLAVTDPQSATRSKGLAVLLGNGDGTFQLPVYFDTGQSPNGLIAGDFNKDGKPDLAMANAFREGTIDAAGSIVNVTVLINTTASLTNVSAASFSAPVAPEMIISAFGSHLANETKGADYTPLPNSLGNTTVKVKDAAGVEHLCPEYYVSPGQVNYFLPKDIAIGAATVTITSSDRTVSIGTMQVAAVAPGLFMLNANGLAAAVVLRVKPGNVQSVENVYQLDASNDVVAKPIDLGAATDSVYLWLFGTGVRRRSSLANVSVTLGTANLPVLFAGDQGQYLGEDQINVGPVPRSVAGSGSVDLVLTTDRLKANTVNLAFK